MLEVVEGEAYGPQLVAESLRNLNAAGVAGEIGAYLEPVGDGVAIVFAIWADYQVETVLLEGEQVFREFRLERQIEVEPGEPLVEDQLIRSVYRLQDYHQERGFLQAKVRLRVDVDDSDKSAQVTFAVSPGEPTRIESIDFEGLAAIEESRLLGSLRSEVGRRYRQAWAREDLSLIHI